MRRMFHAHPRMFLTAAEFIIEAFRKTATYFVAQFGILIITLAAIDTGLGISELSPSQHIAVDLAVSNIFYTLTLIGGVLTVAWYLFQALSRLTGEIHDKFNISTAVWSVITIMILRKLQVASLYTSQGVVLGLILISVILMLARRHILDFVYNRTVSALRSDKDAIKPAYPGGSSTPVRFRNSVRLWYPPQVVWANEVSLDTAVNIKVNKQDAQEDISPSESNTDEVIAHLLNENESDRDVDDILDDNIVPEEEPIASEAERDAKIEEGTSDGVLTDIAAQTKRGRAFVQRKKTAHRPVRDKGSKFGKSRGSGRPYSSNPRTVRKRPRSRKH